MYIFVTKSISKIEINTQYMWFTNSGCPKACLCNCVTSLAFDLWVFSLQNGCLFVCLVMWWCVIEYGSLYAKCSLIFYSSFKLTWSLHVICSLNVSTTYCTICKVQVFLFLFKCKRDNRFTWVIRVEHMKLIWKELKLPKYPKDVVELI